MALKHFLLVLCLVSAATVSFAQPEGENWDNAIPVSYPYHLRLGFNVSRSGAADISMYRDFSQKYKYISYGPSLGSELVLDFKDNFFVAPKLAFEYHYLLAGARLNLLYYTDTKLSQGALKFRPEIGASLFGRVWLFYSYTFNLTNRELYKMKHGVTIGLNVAKFKRKKKAVV